VKRWHSIVLLGIFALGAVYVYLHRQELGLAGPARTPSLDSATLSLASTGTKPPQITWAMVNRPKDGFSVEMPTDVKEIQIPAYNESGGADQVNMIFSNPDAQTTFSVSWADNPPVVRANGRNSEKVLDMARDDALTRSQTRLVNETRSSVEGFASRDILARNAEGGILNTRLLFAGDRLYMLTTVFPSSEARREQDVIRFFNSFKASGTLRNP